MTNPFEVEQQFRAYLKRVYGNNPIPSSQLTELRRCFFGAWGQFLVVLQEGIAELSEKEAVETLEGMKSEVGNFFNSEARGQN